MLSVAFHTPRQQHYARNGPARATLPLASPEHSPTVVMSRRRCAAVAKVKRNSAKPDSHIFSSHPAAFLHR